jgi:hypothetical protein
MSSDDLGGKVCDFKSRRLSVAFTTLIICSTIGAIAYFADSSLRAYFSAQGRDWALDKAIHDIATANKAIESQAEKISKQDERISRQDEKISKQEMELAKLKLAVKLNASQASESASALMPSGISTPAVTAPKPDRDDHAQKAVNGRYPYRLVQAKVSDAEKPAAGYAADDRKIWCPEIFVNNGYCSKDSIWPFSADEAKASVSADKFDITPEGITHRPSGAQLIAYPAMPTKLDFSPGSLMDPSAGFDYYLVRRTMFSIWKYYAAGDKKPSERK